MYIIRSHRTHSVNAADCQRRSGVVCVGLVTTVSHAKTDEQIELPFGGQTCVRKEAVYWMGV